MKREDLEKLGLSKEQVDSVMGLHGTDIEIHKTKINDLTANQSSLATQLEEANKQIESFKGMNIDQIKASADEYKTKFEQAQTESATQLANLKFDHALESALTTAKAKNPKAVTALLSTDELKNAKGEFAQELFEKQLADIKAKNDYLFEGDKPTPKIVTGANSQTVLSDPATQAMRKAAGLPTS